MQQPAPEPLSDFTLFRRTLVVAAGAGTAVLLWKLVDLILLLAAAMLVAFIFYKFTHLIRRRLKMPFALALALAVILPTLVLVFAFAMFGNLMADQFTILFAQLPAAWAKVQAWLATSEIGREVTAHAGSYMPEGGRVVAMLQSVFSSLGTVATSLVVVVVGGIYLAAQPRLYGEGILNLIPPRGRRKTVEAVGAIADALSAWLKAQALSMLFVGIFTGVALSLVGIPAAPAIGLVAALCELVPSICSIVVALTAILI